VSLPSGAVTTLLDSGSYPNLQHYDVIEWQRHVTKGDVFRVCEGRNSCVIEHTGSILIWDQDLDGEPEDVEELTAQQFRAAHYDEGAVWEPHRSLQVWD
jgi:hypothetical protein